MITTTLTLTLSAFLLLGSGQLPQGQDYCNLPPHEIVWRMMAAEGGYQPDNALAAYAWVAKRLAEDRKGVWCDTLEAYTSYTYAMSQYGQVKGPQRAWYASSSDFPQEMFEKWATITWGVLQDTIPDPSNGMDHFDDVHNVEAWGPKHLSTRGCDKIQLGDILFYRLWNCPHNQQTPTVASRQTLTSRSAEGSSQKELRTISRLLLLP